MMQRRLFLIFLLLALTPALLILGLNWRMSQQHLAYLESPGIGRALESSLELARGVLQAERLRAGAEIEALAAGLEATPVRIPELPAGVCWRVMTVGGTQPALGAGALDPFTGLDGVELPGGWTAGETRVERIRHAGRHWLLAERALRFGGEEPARVRLLLPLEPARVEQLEAIAAGSGYFRQLRLYYSTLLRGDTLLTLALIALATVLASLWLARILARQIAEPITALARSAEIVAGGDLDHQLEVAAQDEVGELIEAFNAMTRDLKRSRTELLRAERVAAWREIARRLAHEIKNPLTPINIALHRIARKVEDADVRECVEAAHEETRNLQRLADEFSRFARLPALRPRRFDLVALLHEVAALYPEDDGLRLEWYDWPAELPLRGDPGQLRQVFGNLLKNAAEAMQGRGRITLTLAAAGHQRVVVQLEDEGPGFDCDPEKLFEPYVTHKPGGTGLGLAIARRIVEDHGGRLGAEPGSGGGALFRVELPTQGLRKEQRDEPDPGSGR
jgi:nitrogen fixation/metabolism regulation signal transduction histidine kinase